MRFRCFIKNRILPAVFLCMLAFPFVNRYMPLFEAKASKENRTLAEKPVLDINLLDPYPEQYESYYNDHFTFRNSYIRFYNFIRFRYLGVNPYPNKVVLGKDEWLFYNNASLPKYRYSKQLTLDQLKGIGQELQERQAFLKDHNCRFYLGIIPAKASVYQEKLIEPYYKAAHDTIESRAIQLVNYLNANTTIKVQYLQDSLLAYKDEYTVYRQYDHHWNELGGFIASKAMLSMIQHDYPALKMTVELEDYKISYLRQNGGDLAQLLGVEDFCSEEHPKLNPVGSISYVEAQKKAGLPIPEGFAYSWGYELRRTTKNKSLPNCMVIRDSFGGYYKDFLSRGFNNTLFIWDKWEYALNKEIFLQERPDVLIIMIPESVLEKLLPEE